MNGMIRFYPSRQICSCAAPSAGTITCALPTFAAGAENIFTWDANDAAIGISGRSASAPNAVGGFTAHCGISLHENQSKASL